MKKIVGEGYYGRKIYENETVLEIVNLHEISESDLAEINKKLEEKNIFIQVKPIGGLLGPLTPETLATLEVIIFLVSTSADIIALVQGIKYAFELIEDKIKPINIENRILKYENEEIIYQKNEKEEIFYKKTEKLIQYVNANDDFHIG